MPNLTDPTLASGRVASTLDDPEVKEAMADQQHEIWAHWMRYLFTCCRRVEVKPCADYPYGANEFLIPVDCVERWQRQLSSPYTRLSEKEKSSDREQAAKVLAVLKRLGLD
jgi:hypothetical protein